MSYTKDKIQGPTSEPSIADVLNRLKRETMLAMNCVLIGKIESYSSVSNTANISICVKRKLLNGEEIEYPQLQDVPIFILSGGTSYVSIPIVAGDFCIVLCCDRSIDDWYLAGQTTAPKDTRCHSLSDAIALVGVKPLTSMTTPIPSSSVCINGGSKKVSLKNTSGNLKTTLDTIISLSTDLIALFKQIQCGAYAMTVPNPLTGFAAIESKISTLSTSVNNIFDTGVT